jgi:precorrin-2 dehydrogenase/sirohydrochlorin ferrochelatase
MPLFPISLKLRERLCVVVGGGVIAESKIQGLLAAEAHVVVVAPEVTESVAAWARAGQIEWQVKAFATDDLCGAFLVVAGTSSPQVNHEVFQQCEAEGILCNVVDDPEFCHFYYPAVVRRGASEGKDPAETKRLLHQLASVEMFQKFLREGERELIGRSGS